MSDHEAPPGDSAPIPFPRRDDVDPELARLAPSQPRRSPWLSLAVVGIGVLLLVRMRHDVAYAVSSRTPVELDAKAAATATPNRLVAVTGIPDYASGLLFEPKGEMYRRGFLRMHGTGSRVFVRTDETSTRHQLGERFVGRLERFDDLSYADEVRAYYEKLLVTRRAPASALAHVTTDASGAALLDDGSGEPMRVAPDGHAWLVVAYPDQIKVSLSKDKFAVEEDARHELERLGAPIVSAAPPDAYAALHGAPATAPSFDFFVRVAPKDRDAYLAKLDAAGFKFAARRDHVPTSGAALARARIEGTTAVVGDARADVSNVLAVEAEARIVVPHDAVVVGEDDLPNDFVWTVAVAALLALFIAFNLFVFATSFRRPAAP